MVLIAALAGLAVSTFAGSDSEISGPAWARPAPKDPELADHPHRGAVRIAVGTPPEMGDAGSGGRTLRSLVLPRLFTAQPDGTWRASLVDPGSDSATLDGLSASFRLREDARWSDGSPITVEDLRRTADARFVTAIEGPDTSGLITVRFNGPLPGWRRLWSEENPILAPSPEVYGGPYRVESLTSGLETVLVRNDGWAGGGAFLDEIRLVLTADFVMERQLLLGGQIDVAAPVPDTVRTRRFEEAPGLEISRDDRGGQIMGLRLNPRAAPESIRRRVAAQFPREMFVDSLLAGEAHRLDGLAPGSSTWRDGGAEHPTTLSGATVTLTVPSDQPLTSLLQRSFAHFVEADGGKAPARTGDPASLASWQRSGEYEVLAEAFYPGPELCWSCHFADVDATLARSADAGDMNAAHALEQRLRDEALYLPLWQGSSVYVWRTGEVSGVRANGYANSVAWNAHTWWRP